MRCRILRTSKFEGDIERIKGNSAFVSIIDSSMKDKFTAEASVLELEKSNLGHIHERGKFNCEIARRNGDVIVRFKPLKRRKLAPKEVKRIRDEIEMDLGDFE